MKRRHLIIGAGNAGLNAAATIARLQPEDEIEMVSHEAWAPYCRCLLTYYLDGVITEEKLFAGGKELIKENRLFYRANTRVVSIDPENLSATFADGRQSRADTILIATGGEPLKPDFPGAELPGIFTLRTFADARAMAPRMRPGGRWAVAGAGLVSLKTIIALHHHNINIDLFATSDRILSQVLDPYAASLAAARLSDHQVSINLKEDIVGVTEAPDQQLKLITSRGRELLVDGLLYGKGVKAASPATKERRANDNISRDDWGATQGRAPAPWQDCADGLMANAELEISPNLFVAGDTAQIFDLARKTYDRLPLWPLAGEQGLIAGANMANHKHPRLKKNYLGGISCNAFSLFGLDFISAGYREIPMDDSGWHTLTEKKEGSYCRLNFYKNQLKGFILCEPGHAKTNRPESGTLRKSGPLLARIKREALAAER